MEHIVRDYLIVRWGNEIAEDIKPLDIQRWLKSLNTESRLAWTTIAKMRGVMSRIYKVGALHELVTKNPVIHVETRCKSMYRAIVITPAQTFNILKSLTNILHHTLVLTCAATALRSSEILALRWADILWEEERIRVSKRWVKGKDGETKTEASDGYVPLTSSPGALSAAVAQPDASHEGHGFCFSLLQGIRSCSRILFLIRC
jgi:integrase